MTMSGDSSTSRPPARRLVLSAIRVSVAMGLIVILYVLAPVSQESAVVNGVLAILAVAVFVLVVVWQLREVSQSDQPVLRGIEALAIVVLLFLGMFAIQYVTQSAGSSSAFTEPLDKFTALYYTVTVFSTVGFGDITPVSVPARSLTMAQMIGNLILLGAVVRVLAGAARQGLERQRRANAQEPEPPSPLL
jgi:F0F1-type ATP synthase assembly protein I